MGKLAGDADQMLGIVAAQQWGSLRRNVVGAAGTRPRGDHHATESAGTQMLAELLRLRSVVGLQWPTHGGALRPVAFQGVGQPGGHRIVVGGDINQKPGPGVGLVGLGQFALPPFDGEQAISQHRIPVDAGFSGAASQCLHAQQDLTLLIEDVDIGLDPAGIDLRHPGVAVVRVSGGVVGAQPRDSHR